MLLSSMDHLNYYSMSKDSFLEIDTSHTGGYSMQGTVLNGDDGSPTYNEENSPKNGTKSSLYKTELCKRFSEFGNCRYGAKCQFAHGLAELRHVVRHPKYKTTKCKSYWGSGHCPYGSRCRFIHEEVEGFSQPQFSPPGNGMSGLGGMFLHEKDHMASLPMDMPASSPRSYLPYGDHVDHVGSVGVGSYPTPLLSSFEKSSWAPPAMSPHSKLGYGVGSDLFAPSPSAAGRKTPSLSAVGSIGSGVATSPTSAAAGYPDFQDAINALMKFSITSPEKADPSSVPTSAGSGGVGGSAPVDIATAIPEPRSVKKPSDFSLESDELWKDFSNVQSSSGDFSEKNWPSGLVLSASSFDEKSIKTKEQLGSPVTLAAATSVVSGSASTSPKGVVAAVSSDEDEGSRRLGVFERFH